MAVKGQKIFRKASYAFAWLAFSFLLACSGNSRSEKNSEQNKKGELTISILWDDDKATGVRIPYALLKGMSFDSARVAVRVQLEDSGADILGEYSSTEDALLFRPLMAFTPGLTYKIDVKGTPITRLNIPYTNLADMSRVISVYPTSDTVPENLLKMYIRFSRPMQEGQALQNIFVTRNERDTIDIFLDIEQELWNHDRTILTLWLDPGRIKRGLQPNERSGIPLQQGQRYRLSIKKKWRNTNGLELEAGYNKQFTVGPRDNNSPSIDHWEFHGALPEAGSQGVLWIKMHEQLDYLLLNSAIRVVDDSGNVMPGRIITYENETELQFAPDRPWRKGNYTLEIEARLEDLAGNNLNRPFDRDISKKDTVRTKEVYTSSFRIQ